MFSNKRYSFTRAALHGLAILGLVVLAAGASASPARAATTFDDILTPLKITVASFSYALSDVTFATVDLVNDPFISCESGFGTGDDTVWFTFTPASSGELNTATTNSGYDTVLAVYSADSLNPPTLTEIGCNNDASALVKTSALKLYLRGGIKYYIEVARDSLDVNVAPDALRFSYSFTPKVIAWGTAGGRKWDSNDGVFTFSPGWTLVPVPGSYKNYISVANNLNNTATTYFDGIGFDLYYVFGPQMGTLEVYVDDILQATLGEGSAAYSFPPGPVVFGPFVDGVHKLVLKNGAPGIFGPKANFDYITVYSFPDFISPDQITDLTATTGTSTGKVTLKWTSVGDDGMVGTATSYEVQYMLNDGFNTCAADWGNPLVASPINWGLPLPKIAGTAQSATLSGLVPGIDYLFCIAAIDDGGNYGLPSNDANAIPYAGIPIGTGTYDDKYAGWAYVGNWKLVTGYNTRYNTLHISNNTSDYAFFYFTGNQFVLTYRSSSLGGLLDVYIDGIWVTSIDQYSPTPLNYRTYTSPILSVIGPHSVRFVHSNLVPSTQVAIDQIYINSPVDGGAPDPIADLAAVPGAADGTVDLSWTATGDDPFGAGTATKYEVRYSTTPINTELDWIYATPAAGLLLAPQVAGTPESATIVGLTPGVHYYFAILAFDNANYNILSTFSGVEDAVATYSGVWSGAAFPGPNYDDADLAWTYNGTWKPQFPLSVTLATNGTQHISAAYATSAVFHFDGTGFILIFQKKIGLGKLAVYVDGVKVGEINQYISSTTPLWQQTWTISGLAPSAYLIGDQHVVEFRLVTGKATIDEIDIIP